MHKVVKYYVEHPKESEIWHMYKAAVTSDMSGREILHTLWSTAQTHKGLAADSLYHKAKRLTSLMGLHMEWVMHQLYFFPSGFEQFCQVLEKESHIHCSEESLQQILFQHEQKCLQPVEPVLTPAQRYNWEQHGYLILPGILTPEQCESARESIWNFLNASETDRDSWYKSHPGKKGLMLTLSHHPALHVVRQSQYLHQVFCELYGSSRIFPLIDKCSFNPPETDRHKFAGSSLHWDTSLAQPVPLQIQGMVYLSHTSTGEGAFSCVPGFHHRFEEWIQQIPEGADVREYALKHLQPIEVTGKAGDFILWHQALPHAATPNRGIHPRMVQYFTYLPDEQTDLRKWI